MSGNGHRTFRYSVPLTFIKRCKKIQRTRKNIVSCARQGLKHLLSSFPQVHCNGCTEQQPMMTAGKSATSLCLATSWQGWLLRTARPKVSTDRLCFQSVRRSIPKNSFQPIGTWEGSAYATCLPRSRTWGLINTHRSRVASVMTFPCLFGWKTAESGSIANPFIREQREE